MQRRERTTCDYTLLAACLHELRHRWLPAKVDQVGLRSCTIYSLHHVHQLAHNMQERVSAHGGRQMLPSRGAWLVAAEGAVKSLSSRGSAVR